MTDSRGDSSSDLLRTTFLPGPEATVICKTSMSAEQFQRIAEEFRKMWEQDAADEHTARLEMMLEACGMLAAVLQSVIAAAHDAQPDR